MEELDVNAQQRRETFALYGLAILISSVFNKEFLPSKPDRREEIQDEVFAKTIGRLLNRLKKQVTLPPNLDKTLITALQKRNWLAHDYFWERAVQLITLSERNKMMDELKGIIDFFSKLDVHLAKIYEKHLMKVGVSETTIDEKLKKLIQNMEE